MGLAQLERGGVGEHGEFFGVVAGLGFMPGETAGIPDTVPWERGAFPRTDGNAGCPDGYVTIYGTAGPFCLRHELATGARVAAETAPSIFDQLVIGAADASRQSVEAVRDAGASVGLTSGTLRLVALAAVVVGIAYVVGQLRR